MRRTSDAAGIEMMKYAAKNADCTSITSPYDSVNSALSFGMITSLRLVMPPNAKNKTNTNACRSVEYLAADDDATGASNVMTMFPLFYCPDHRGQARFATQNHIVRGSSDAHPIGTAFHMPLSACLVEGCQQARIRDELNLSALARFERDALKTDQSTHRRTGCRGQVCLRHSGARPRTAVAHRKAHTQCLAAGYGEMIVVEVAVRQAEAEREQRSNSMRGVPAIPDIGALRVVDADCLIPRAAEIRQRRP